MTEGERKYREEMTEIGKRNSVMKGEKEERKYREEMIERGKRNTGKK